ncbi:MAG: site-specific recombinase XerD [Francisellaceae bacterium]|jgi:site-specific recombinase XerD
MVNKTTSLAEYIPPAMPKSRSGLIKLRDMEYDQTSPVAQYLLTLNSVASQRTMYRCLRQFSQWYYHNLKALPEHVNWSEVTYSHVLDYQMYLRFKPDARDPTNEDKIKALSASTRNTYIIAIRGVMKKASRLSVIAPQHKVDKSVYLEISEIVLAPVKSLAKSRALFDYEVDAFLESFESHGKNFVRKDKNLRDKAIFFVLASCGLRVGELVSMQYPANVKFEEQSIQIVGKGAKERKVPMNDQVADILKQYLSNLRGHLPGQLWHPINRHGTLQRASQLTEGGVRHMLHKRGFPLKANITPHYLRKHFGTNLLAGGTDILQTRDLLGHTSVNTTQIYDTRGDEGKVEGVKSLIIKHSKR